VLRVFSILQKNVCHTGCTHLPSTPHEYHLLQEAFNGSSSYTYIHNDTSFIRFLIPGLTRNPVFFWIPAFAGMTPFAVIDVAVYILAGKMKRLH
jgi:hypothetical protein